MEKVYAVNSGCYSDYRVNAIFSTRKLAKEFMKLVPNSDYNEIEEFVLDPSAPDLIRRGYLIWRIHMLRDGTTELCEKKETDLFNVTYIGHSIWRRTKAPAYKGKDVQDVLTSRVWAKTEKQAMKIVNEHRGQMLANGEW